MARAKTHYHDHRPKGTKKKSFEKVYWPYIALVAVWFSIALTPLSSRVATPIGKHNVLAYATTMSINGLLSSTNDSRANNGAAALSLNSKLNAAAQSKANDMAARDYWSHNTPDGNPPWVFVDAQGYAYTKIGENLATGFNDEQATINGWMNSPGHRANMLDTTFREVGFGFANSANYTAVGGGPMTIVVAFYGLSNSSPPPSVVVTTCPTGLIGTPPNCSMPPATKPSTTPPAIASSNPTAAETPTLSTPQAPTASKESPSPVRQSKPLAAEQPVTNKSTQTESPSKQTAEFQTISGSPAATKVISGLASFGLVLAAAVWAGKHILSFRRTLKKGEQFVITHPLVDVVLLAVVLAVITLSSTSGFIR